MNKNGHEQRKEREVLAKVTSWNKVLQLHVNGGEQPQFLVLVNKLLCSSETEADVMQLLMSHSPTPLGTPLQVYIMLLLNHNHDKQP